MNRMFLVFTVIMGLLAGMLSNTPVADSTLKDQLLTIEEGNGWTYALEANESSGPSVNLWYQDGEPAMEIQPAANELYQEYGLENGYQFFANLLPTSIPTGEELTYTLVDIRLFEFNSPEESAKFADEYLDNLIGVNPNSGTSAIEPSPNSDLDLVGFTSMDGFQNLETGEATGTAGGVGYLSAIGNFVISAKVSGPLVDYNFDAALWLLEAQAECVNENSCAGIPMPMGGGHWEVGSEGVIFADEDGNVQAARWIFPIDEPITKPEMSMRHRE